MNQLRPESGPLVGHSLRGSQGAAILDHNGAASTPLGGGSQLLHLKPEHAVVEPPRLTLHGGVDPTDLRASVRAATLRAQLVDLEALVRFVFPPELQHAMSTGRLLAFGFYGPLDSAGQLRSGHKGSHVLQRWELDTMCRQFEREDILAVYMPRGKSPFALSDAEAEELLAQADARLKCAKGKAMMRQVTPDELRALFDGLPRDPTTGLLNFHQCQARLMAYRAESIQRNKVVFPDLQGHAKKKTPQLPSSQGSGNGSGNGSGQGGAKGKKSFRASADVAPPTMFQKDAGLLPMEIAQRTNKFLSTRAYQICEINDGNSPSLTANVRLLREEMALGRRNAPVNHPAAGWDHNAARRRTNVGGFVKSAASSTTVKRNTTLLDHN